MNNLERYEIVVIGGGPVGITMAKKLGGKFKMAVIRPEDHSMIYCAMPYVIEGLIPIEKTFKKDQLVTDSGAELIRGMVETIDFEQKLLMLAGGRQIAYEKLIIATGAMPLIPRLPGTDLHGVMGFKSEDHLQTFLAMIKAGFKKVAVVGAGAIGVELAQAFQESGIHTTLIDAEGSVLPNMVDQEMMIRPGEELIRQGIHVILNARIESLSGHKYVEHIKLGNGEIIHFDDMDECSLGDNIPIKGLAVFATGSQAETSLVNDTPIEVGKDGIKVNSRMETNLPDVYACGDCVEFTSAITGKIISGKLATNAVPMAKVLADNLLGKDRHYSGFYNGAATKVGKFFVGGTGLTARNAGRLGIDIKVGFGETTSKFPMMPGTTPLRVKLVARADNGKLIGGQVLSGEPVAARIDLLTYAIQLGSTVKDLSHLSYSSQPYQSFMPAANAVVLAAEDLLLKG